MAHVLIALPKADPEAKTFSGKCSQGDARYNGDSTISIENQHEAHLRDIGVIDDEDPSMLNDAEDEAPAGE